MKNLFFLGLLFTTFASCSNTELYEKMTGDWVCASWVNQSTGKDMCQDNVEFHFSVDKTYTSRFNSNKESGTFKVADFVLYVTPKGKSEFGVKIQRADADTLVFLMNRSGTQELLTLSKK